MSEIEYSRETLLELVHCFAGDDRLDEFGDAIDAFERVVQEHWKSEFEACYDSLIESRAEAQQQAKRAEDLLANQTHIQNQIQAALGNGANEQLWQPGEHWLIAACRVISERDALAARVRAIQGHAAVGLMILQRNPWPTPDCSVWGTLENALKQIGAALRNESEGGEK